MSPVSPAIPQHPETTSIPHVPSPSVLEARRFLRDLREEIRVHPGVNHIFLNRVATMPFTQEDYRVLGLQHYPLVNCFTSYMENLLIHAPDSDAKRWLAKVLVDEYGEGSDGQDHSTLYYRYLTAAGSTPSEIESTILNPATVEFIRTHIELTTKEPFLVGLGAIGPGHEWSIPTMFSSIIPGLRRAGFKEDEILYFWLHQEQDEDHGAWLEEALALYATTPQNRAMIREGALRSLAARERFWTGVQSEVVRWRQPSSAPTFRRRLRAVVNRTFRTTSSWAGEGHLAHALTVLRRKVAPVYIADVIPIERRPPHA